jgi:hypothetical protein
MKVIPRDSRREFPQGYHCWRWLPFCREERDARKMGILSFFRHAIGRSSGGGAERAIGQSQVPIRLERTLVPRLLAWICSFHLGDGVGEVDERWHEEVQKFVVRAPQDPQQDASGPPVIRCISASCLPAVKQQQLLDVWKAGDSRTSFQVSSLSINSLTEDPEILSTGYPSSEHQPRFSIGPDCPGVACLHLLESVGATWDVGFQLQSMSVRFVLNLGGADLISSPLVG